LACSTMVIHQQSNSLKVPAFPNMEVYFEIDF
jgi:hypothetical protein